MNATHIVVHPFDADGRSLANGDRVDASGWKNVEKLVSVKYLRVITPADLVRSPQKRTVVATATPRKPLKKLVIKRK